ncbi:hypothetical protein [Streptomyces sp. NBC_01089]|uniref:hypothetical protein n=1 Tax=Streptomyces sp. NBC_01089 TaxID=2903747 RepID=UPI003866AEC8|nr:hypothetical protein OG510_35510 [Streptomyces sp. NBC_01089]
MGTLYNLGPVVDRLAPALLGMPPGGGRWVDRVYPEGDPVVEVVGGRSSGKTTLLDALNDGYHSHLPTARVDLGAAPYSATDRGDLARLDTVNASPVTNLLFTLSHQLGRERDRTSHTLTFPRLSAALLVLTVWRPDAQQDEEVRPADLVAAEQELRTVLAQRNPDPQIRRAGIQRWLDAVNGVVAGLLPGVPGLQGVLDAATRSLLERESEDSGWAWWRSRLDRLDGDAAQRLFALVRKFRSRGADRQDVEAHLIDALLADINGGYGYWTRRTQHPPLILLDNLDEALRTRFLTPFTDRYAAATGQWTGRGRVMLPIVFATSLGDGSDPALVPTTHESPWTAPERRPPLSWLLRLGIPPVTEADVRAMLGDVVRPPSLPSVIARIGGGRAGNAMLLADAAVARLRDGAPFPMDLLLSLRLPDSPVPLGTRLLGQLLPDAAARARATALAPAMDGEAAVRLLRTAHSVQRELPGVGLELSVRQLRDSVLDLPHWNHRPWPGGPHPGFPLVTDRALRALLLGELREQSGEEQWGRLHAALAAQYNRGDVRSDDSDRHEPRYLHHALAQGRLDTVVVRALHHQYTERTPADWLRAVNLVAAAPPAWSGYASGDTPERTDAPLCHSCTTDADRRVHGAIRRLVTTVWQLSAPLAAVPTGHADPVTVQVRTALEALCDDYSNRPRRDRAYNAYVDAVADDGWIDALVSGVQAPDLPVDGR